MLEISSRLGDEDGKEGPMTSINEGMNKIGLAAAVANSTALSSTSTSTSTPGTAIPGTTEQHVQSALPARFPSPSITTSNVTRIYGGSDRGGNSAGRGGSSEDIRSRLLSRLGIYGSSPPIYGSSHKTMVPPQMQSQPLTAAQHRRVRILRGMGVGYNMFHQSPPDGSATRRPLSGVVPSKEPLKSGFHSDDENDDDCDDESIVVPDDSDDDNDNDEDGRGNKIRRSSSSSNTSKTKTKRSSAYKLKPKKTRIAFQDQVEVMPIPTRHEYSNRIKSRIWSNRYELKENAERNAVEFASEGWNWRNVTEDEGMYICSVSGELVHPAWVGGLPTLEKGASPTGASITGGDSTETTATTVGSSGRIDGAPIGDGGGL